MDTVYFHLYWSVYNIWTNKQCGVTVLLWMGGRGHTTYSLTLTPPPTTSSSHPHTPTHTHNKNCTFFAFSTWVWWTDQWTNGPMNKASCRVKNGKMSIWDAFWVCVLVRVGGLAFGCGLDAPTHPSKTNIVTMHYLLLFAYRRHFLWATTFLCLVTWWCLM